MTKFVATPLAVVRVDGRGQLLEVRESKNGPASRWAGYFDVDWDPPEARLRNTVLMPVLADHYGRVNVATEENYHD